MRTLRALASLLFASALVPAWAERAAEIVSVQGKGEQRPSATAEWQPAKVKQTLEGGAFVRTTEATSKMALMLADQTQVTLQGVSIVQVKAPEAAGERKSILEFGKGTGRFQTKTPTKSFTMGTPTGLAAIRGTEWLVEVDDEGRSAFTVVEGEIEISNELGTLPVGADEQGILEKGKPPTKVRLQNARERVQWVSSFTLDPSRYGTGEADRELAAVETELYNGRVPAAIERLDRAAARYPNDSRIPALAARAALLADDFPRARTAAAAAVAKFPDSVESLLAAGEVARLDGDFSTARTHFRRATLAAPRDWRGWHALGRLMSERADWRRARRALDEADKAAPNNAQVLSERGMMEASAYDVPKARELLDRAIAAQPDDFSSWTGLGIARLRSGDPDGAVEALLKATLLEPRYARAHINLAIAYYQQGRAGDALKELRAASLHDPRDPVPFQLASMIQADLLEPGDALASAREAVARLPYVKSLDAIANNLRGTSNLGAPLAQLGLEAWSLKNAHDSFDPLWAGSHLFLGDRLSSKFSANSEYLQGFLTDPLVFGASNRFQTLLPRPGHYGSIAARGSHSGDGRTAEPSANVNGLIDEGRIAYFLDGENLRKWLLDEAAEERAGSVTLGLGFKPSDAIGFFFYYNYINPDAQFGDPPGSVSSPYTRIHGNGERYDAGMHWRPGPDSQVWFKGGHASEDQVQEDRSTIRVGNAQFLRDSYFTASPRRNDLALRALHRFSNGLECSLVVEGANWQSVDFLERDAFGRNSPAASRLLESVRQQIRDDSRSAAVGLRWPVNASFLVDLEVDRTTYEKTNDILVRRDFANQLVPLTDNHDRDDWSGRAGAVFKPGAGFTLRGAWQQWLRPASIASLKPAATAGIVLDDRFVLPGGRFERARAQVEWEAPRDILVQAFYDRQEIDNLYSPLIGVLNNRPDITNLQRLRNRSFNALASLDILEGFPDLSKGELREAGLAVNALVSRQLSVFVEALHSDSENTGAFPGRVFAYLPKHRYAIGATWFTDRRFNLATKWIYRTERFEDEANLRRIQAEWNGAIQAYWETADKRWSFEALVNKIASKTVKDELALAVTFRF